MASRQSQILPHRDTKLLRKSEQTNDLAELVSVSDESVVACLRDRYLMDLIYTALGPSSLVAINPHKVVHANSDATLALYGQDYRNTEEGRDVLPPHIFGMAEKAYFDMRRTGRDQSILMSGETGSGKSELRRLATKALVDLSVPGVGKKGAKLSAQIPNAEFILEALGNARTIHNPNASRFGKYTELQFTDRGRLIGAKTLDYYLERSRVAGPSPGERNFHVFYYLIAGASTEEQHYLKLSSDPSHYRLLHSGGVRSHQPRAGGGGVGGEANEDRVRFEQLKQAFKLAGVTKKYIAQVCQLVAAILHLGNLEFTMDYERNPDAAVVRNWDVLETVAEFLGVGPAELEEVLNSKVEMINKDMVNVFLDPEGASANRDDLAKSLYSLLFAWMNEHINERLCKADFTNYIGILDLPGFQNLSGFGARSNSIDQFCVNFANERLENWILQRTYELQTAEFAAEGLAKVVPQVSYADNSETIRLLTTIPGGVVHIVDDQTRRMPKKTDHSMADALAKRWGNHQAFKAGGLDRTGYPTFTLQHYTGPVTYSAENFLEKNADAVNPDFVALLRGPASHKTATAPSGSSFPGSTNPFVRDLFGSQAIATQVHPRDQATVVGAQQSVKPLRQPSTKRKGGRGGALKMTAAAAGPDEDDYEGTDDKPSASNASAPGQIRCVVGEFKSALDVLFEAFDETRCWTVFALTPNDVQLPNQLESRGLKAQVRSLGLADMAKRVVVDYEVSMSHTEFCERYAEELEGFEGASAADVVGQLKAARGWTDRELAVGQYKVFVGHGPFRKLEDHLRATDADELKHKQERELDGKLGVSGGAGGLDPFSPYRYSTYDLDQVDSRNLGATSTGNLSMFSQTMPLVGGGHDNSSGGRLNEPDFDSKTMRSYDDYAPTHFTSNLDDSTSNVGTEAYAPSKNMFGALEKSNLNGKELDEGAGKEETTEVYKVSGARKKWLVLVWALTWWLPNFFLGLFKPFKRPDVRQAWREKLAINLIIWFIMGCTVFVIAILGLIICPTQHVYSQGEISSQSYENNPDNEYVSIRGEVFDLTSIAKTHQVVIPIVKEKAVLQYGGLDASSLFPVQVSALCDGVDGSVSPWVQISSLNSSSSTDTNSIYHDFRANTNDSRPDWYYEQMIYMRYNFRKGFVGILPKTIKSNAGNGDAVAIYNQHVYDITDYIKSPPYLKAPDGEQADRTTSTSFLSEHIVQLLQQQAGKDITKRMDALVTNGVIDAATLQRQLTCLRNLYLVGLVDNRQSTKCKFSEYLLLVISVLMVAIIGFKFLGALWFGSRKAPQDHDKFVICQVPCYTEGEGSLKKTIDSIARLRYDDKRKLIAVICDGNIVGSGNDRSTPRIVLDILGVDPNLDPEALSFLSLGEGNRQHNMGKIYSGLYECAGHVVPYLVIVKCGKPNERNRPGNRGKRDSQMILMHFLNKVHFNSAMSPLELEIYHQVKNVIGVNPSFYEYLFTVDADTTADENALNFLISAMINDKKVIACCGETSLANAKQSLVTMMQVYEYFISHHLAKSFESLFGSVTCLPGCFTLYRLRTPDTHKPLFISDQIILDYSENRVDTLHLKNLLHLGEDRYLTTLLLKHFPTYKTTFVRPAHAETVAPDDWRVLMSQRRRWINSTVHNLAELIFVDKLCGFCCFSMRFVVLIDLVSTITAPVTVAYIIYLIVLVAAQGKSIPTLSIIMLAAIYGLQALIFLFRGKWDMIGWMIFYILAIPIFSFLLPLMSFWAMDDFSWGSTRLIQGEGGKKLIQHTEGHFDPKVIPLKTWNDYENELWDRESNHSVGSWVPPSKRQMMEGGGAESLYGQQTLYNAPIGRGGSPSVFDRQANYSPQGSHGGHLPASNSYYADQGRGSQYGGVAGQYHDNQPYYDNERAPSMYQSHGGYVPSNLGRPDSEFLPPMTGTTPFADGASPSDEEIESFIWTYLSSVDLNTVSKKKVRAALDAEFGVDLSDRKALINNYIADAVSELTQQNP